MKEQKRGGSEGKNEETNEQMEEGNEGGKKERARKRVRIGHCRNTEERILTSSGVFSGPFWEETEPMRVEVRS